MFSWCTLRKVGRQLYLKLRHWNYDFLMVFSWFHQKFASFCNRWLFWGHVTYVNMDAQHGQSPTAIFTRESQLPRPRAGTLRLVILSDTHLYHRSLWVPSGDMLIHAGDFLAEWGHGPMEFLDFLEWMKELPHHKKLLTAGNHDRIVEKMGPVRAAEVFGRVGVTFLHPDVAELVNVLQLRISGAPWSLPGRTKSRNKAFQLPDSGDERLLRIPDCDILVTHGPPRSGWSKAVVAKRPRLHIFGHEHDNYGVKFADGTVSINAALCNDFFCALRRPVVVDLPRCGPSTMTGEDVLKS